jgi:hypothetical protein
MRSRLHLFAFVFSALALGTTAASAQSASPDEVIRPDGGVAPSVALTPAQRNVIYNAVIRQQVRPAADRLSPMIGAPVPPSTELLDLPNLVSNDDTAAGLLKYAMVQSDIVVVDPLSMRVVDVIHGGAKP